MKTTQNGLNLIKQFESLSLKAYPDPEDAGGLPWTIGYGSTLHSIPPGETFDLDTTIDLATAERWTEYHIETNIEPEIDKLVDYELNPNEYDALVSFCYNLGVGCLENSTLLKYINNDDFANAQLEFLKFCIAGGKQVRGLLRRRLAEASLFGMLTRAEMIAQYLGGFDPDQPE